MRTVFALLVAVLSVVPPLECAEVQPSRPAAARIDSLFAHLEEHKLFRGAALVSDDGLKVYETAIGLADEAWGIPNSTDTRYLIASLSKQFAAVTILQLVDEGCLSLDVPIAEYMSRLPESWSGKVTVRDLLNQTSGIPDYTLLPGYTERIAMRRFTRDDFLGIICEESLFSATQFEPGEDWQYSNTNYFLLGIPSSRRSPLPPAASTRP